MKKLILLLLIFLVSGCSATDSEKNNYYKELINNYQFEENTLVVLENESSTTDMSICGNNNLDLIKMSNDVYEIDMYYLDSQEYISITKDGVSDYYSVDISPLYDNPMDIYTEMVMDASNVKSILYMGDETIDGVECANISCKIQNTSCNIYFSKLDDQLICLSYVGGNKLYFDTYDLVLPEEFNNAKKVDADYINEIISDFQNTID